MSKTVEYFFAPQSPWTYLGHERLVDICKRHKAHIELRPMDLAKVFNASGGLPLAKRPPQRQSYRLVELKRWSEFLNIPLKPQPAFFPVSGDAAACLIIAARLAHGSEAALRLTGAIMRALWSEDKNIGDAATLASIAFDCELEGQDLVKSSETAGIQAEYGRNTDAALAASVFGSPWYVIDGEPFWGQDRLDFVERKLAAG